MFDPFEINFKRRLAEDPDYYNRYIRDTHSRMDKLINNILVNTSKPSKRTVVRRQPFVNSNSRATNNGQRSTKRATRIFDKANSSKSNVGPAAPLPKLTMIFMLGITFTSTKSLH